jgi:hypothetical protein
LESGKVLEFPQTSELDKQYLELEKQQQLIKQQADLITNTTNKK